MTPSLPVALVILTVLGAPALAAPAPAAPDFEPMAVCSPDAHNYFTQSKNFAKAASAEKVAANRKTFADKLHGATKLTDQAAWSVDNKTSLPAGCRIGEPKIKAGVYAALSELRREIHKKAGPSLKGEELAEAEYLTGKESSVDELMGGDAKSLTEFKTKLAGLGLDRDTGATENPTRAQLLAQRYRTLRGQIEAYDTVGGALPWRNIPDAVRDRETKSAAEAKKRADAAKGLGFGDKVDDMPSGPQTAGDGNEGNRAGDITAEIQGSGADDPGTLTEAVAADRAAAAALITKKPSRARVEPAIITAELNEDTDPEEPDSSVLTEAVKNSATKPLGGAVNPPAPNEAENYDTRKEAIKAKTLRLRKGRGMKNDEEDLAFRSKLPFTMVATVRNGNGVVTLVSPSGTPLKRVQIVNGKPVVKPGELTAVEAGFIEGELE